VSAQCAAVRLEINSPVTSALESVYVNFVFLLRFLVFEIKSLYWRTDDRTKRPQCDH